MHHQVTRFPKASTHIPEREDGDDAQGSVRPEKYYILLQCRSSLISARFLYAPPSHLLSTASTHIPEREDGEDAQGLGQAREILNFTSVSIVAHQCTEFVCTTKSNALTSPSARTARTPRGSVRPESRASCTAIRLFFVAK
jgi:hypothetical protein